jgi:DNA-binding NtrC family response regulator
MSLPNSTTSRRILVIDDSVNIHEDFRKILCSDRGSGSKLEAAGAALFGDAELLTRQAEFEVDSAFQGIHGLARVYHAIQEGRPYAMAFLDVRMPPGWDGIEVAPKLWVADPDLQIVICTADPGYSWEEIIAKLGTDRLVILKKPFDRMEVLQLAHNLTERWQTRQIRRSEQKKAEKDAQLRALVAENKSEKLYAEIMQLLQKKNP